MELALNKFSTLNIVREASVAVTLRKTRCAESKKVDGSRPAVRGEAVREMRECAGNLAVALKISLSNSYSVH